MSDAQSQVPSPESDPYGQVFEAFIQWDTTHPNTIENPETTCQNFDQTDLKYLFSTIYNRYHSNDNDIIHVWVKFVAGLRSYIIKHDDETEFVNDYGRFVQEKTGLNIVYKGLLSIIEKPDLVNLLSLENIPKEDDTIKLSEFQWDTTFQPDILTDVTKVMAVIFLVRIYNNHLAVSKDINTNPNTGFNNNEMYLGNPGQTYKLRM